MCRHKIKVRIPAPLQGLTKGREEIDIEKKGLSLKEMIDQLEREYPGIKQRLCDEEGRLRRFINIYVNNEDIRFLKGEDTHLSSGDEVSIIPAIAGG